MNPATDADPTWMPLLTTPPYPSYAGNMACIGASSARALALYFGTNDVLVSGGIHFHFDTLASQEVCPEVAGYIFGNFMRPKHN